MKKKNKSKKGYIIWIIGLAGSGKTTLGKILYRKLKEKKPNTCFIDGDEFRKINKNDLGYSNHDRRINATRIINLCKLLYKQNQNVIVALLHNFPDQRKTNRKIFSNYCEVFIDTSKKTIISRNQKNLYLKKNGKKIKNVIGVDIKFKKPTNPDIILDGDKNPKENVKKIIQVIS